MVNSVGSKKKIAFHKVFFNKPVLTAFLLEIQLREYYMITKWGVKNFKSILEADLELAPLTVFTGINSSGKSAFLQSIAMLTQTARSKDYGVIKLKGDLIDLGIFERIYHKNSAGNKEPQKGVIGINCIISSNEYEYARLELGLSEHEQGNEKLFKHQWHEEDLNKIKNSTKEINKVIEEIETTGIKNMEYGNLDLKIIGELNIIVEKSNSIKKDYDDSVSSKLFINQALMECKKTGDKDAKCIKAGYDNSEPFDKIQQKLKSGGDYNTITPEMCNVDFKNSSFIPSRIGYKPYGKLHRYLDPNKETDISRLAKILSDIPDEKLTIKEEAEKYYEEKIYSDYGWDENDSFLFYLCTNNHKMVEKNEEIDEKTAMFDMIPGLRDLFDKKNFVKKYDTGSEYYDIKFSDWYQVMSEQDKNTKEAITKELKNFEGFAASLLNKIDELKNKFEVLDLPFPWLDWFDGAWKHLYNYFKNKIKYIGPLREDPKWKYTEKNKKDNLDFFLNTFLEIHYDGSIDIDDYLAQIELDVGIKGENTLYMIYYMDKYKKIDNYYSPEFFETPDFKTQNDKKFITALEEWLKYIGIIRITDKIIIEERENLPRILIIMNGHEFYLPEIGTGISQILPILVMCLAAPVGSTLIIQEPEKNLHPKWQSLLADFFIAMSLSGRQCLVETHSEYIIEQLRYRIIMLSDRFFNIDGEQKRLHELTKLYFVTKNEDISVFKDIVIDEYASLDEWPDDFFDESHNITRRMMDEIAKKEESDEEND